VNTATAQQRIPEPPRAPLPGFRSGSAWLWPAGLGLALWLASSLYVVSADQQAVVTRFARVVESRVLPGLHISLPWPVDKVTRLKVRQQQRAIIGGDVADAVTGRTDPLRSQFLTGDKNLIHIRAVVQYSVGVPVDYLVSATDVAQLIASAVESQLASSVARLKVDDILTTAKIYLQDEVRGAAQKQLNELRAGVIISSINIESVSPPAEAADAFREVASARADFSRIVNEAQGYANDVLPRARGESQQMIETAKGYRQRLIDQAQGDSARFLQVAGEYAKASQVNGRRLYVETLEQVLPRIRKVFVDRNGNVDLTLVGKGAASDKK
jgi:modulator of FtsH protease HflK